MSLDPAAVRRIAKLSRLHLEDHEIPNLQADLNGILGWIEQLNEVDVDGVEPMAGATQGVVLRLRDDVVTDGNQAEAVLSNAPDKAGNFYAVPKVVE